MKDTVAGRNSAFPIFTVIFGYGSMIEGVFAIYKDEGMTSHDVVREIRRLTHQKRVGHAGTLDPCAKGVLVVGVGRAATKTLKLVVGTEKEYLTRIKLGWRSTTDDREGRIEPATFPSIPSEEQVRQALAGFQGVIDQRPPAFSAIKVNGRAAYKLARAAREVDLPARKVEAKAVELLGYAWPYVDVRLVTGPGILRAVAGPRLGRNPRHRRIHGGTGANPRRPVHEGTGRPAGGLAPRSRATVTFGPRQSGTLRTAAPAWTGTPRGCCRRTQKAATPERTYPAGVSFRTGPVPTQSATSVQDHQHDRGDAPGAARRSGPCAGRDWSRVTPGPG